MHFFDFNIILWNQTEFPLKCPFFFLFLMASSSEICLPRLPRARIKDVYQQCKALMHIF